MFTASDTVKYDKKKTVGGLSGRAAPTQGETL